MMTVYEYSVKVNKNVDEILMLCKSLGINVTSKDDILSADDIVLLDKNLQNIIYSSPSSGGSFGGGGGGGNTTTYFVPDKSTNPATTQNTNSEINIDPECFIKECNLVKNIAGELSSFSESINSVNINGDEFINNDLIKESQNIGSILDSQKETLSTMVTGINELQERIVGVRIKLEENNPELALLFSWLDTEYFDEFNKNDDLVETVEKESLEQQTTSLESEQGNNDKSANDVTTADAPTSEFTESLDNLSTKSDTNPNSYTTYLQPKNNTDISHRGYTHGDNKYEYENSAGAYRLAGEKGFWGCEADIRLYNGNLVCSHNPPKNTTSLTSFEEYLDICKEYGMTAIIDLKYEGNDSNTPEPELAEGIIKTIEEKGMLDNCILQTNSHKDIPHIRELSEDARIWYLVDTPDVIDKYITPYKVEGVNICAYKDSGTTLQRIKTFANNGIDVCVWGVTTENGKQKYLDAGALHVMSDNVLGITPYQEGQFDYNGIAS